MSKTSIATSQVQTLAENIERLESAIATTERQFLSQQQENVEFAEALRLLSVGVAAYVPEGRVPMVDIISGVLDEASDQSDREYRWNACQQALDLGQQAASNIDAELTQLRNELAIALDEQDWVENYEPHASKYQDGFTLPSPEVKKEREIKRMRDDIIDRKTKLERTQSWLNAREGERPYYAGNAWTEFEYLSKVIPVLQQQLEQLIAESVREDKEYERRFRSYVRSRVAIEPALDAFMKAQETYLAALGEFKMAIVTYPEGAMFPAAVLEPPRLVVAETSIKLTDAEQPPVKARLW